MQSLAGKVAIVTGGGTGIGRGLTLALADQQVNVVLCGRREAPLEETVRAVWGSGGSAIAVQADVSQATDVESLVDRALDQFGVIDILINNAGVGGGEPIHQHSIESWDQIMAVNLRGPFLMCRAVLGHMRARQSGHIINISSESALEHYPGNGAYGVAKHGLNALSEYIQRENQDMNIRVDVVCPGMVLSEMSENSPGLDHSKTLYPEDIAELALWLLTRRPNIKIGRPVLIQTMENPWE